MTGRRSVRARVTTSFVACVAAVGLLTAGTIVLLVAYAPETVRSSTPALPATTMGTGDLVMPDAAQPTVSAPGSDLGRLLICSAIAFVLVVVLGVLTVRRVVRRALSPLVDISDAARRAATTDLDARVSVDAAAERPGDEVVELALLFNDMLARLQLAFEAQQRFAANAAHELQTPLATTQALLDVALTGGHDAKVSGLLTDLRSLNSRSVASVQALLDLAETANAADRFEVFDLDHVVGEVLGLAEQDSTAADVTITSSLDSVTVRGEVRLARLLLRNVVDNAIRHNLPGGVVQIRLAAAGDHAELTVSNSGPRLDDDDVRTITEPFARVSGRTAAVGNTSSGRGLGGAIVAAVAERHGWALAIDANAGGGITLRVGFEPVAATSDANPPLHAGTVTARPAS